MRAKARASQQAYVSVGGGRESIGSVDRPPDTTRREAERDQPNNSTASLAAHGLFSVSAKQARGEEG